MTLCSSVLLTFARNNRTIRESQNRDQDAAADCFLFEALGTFHDFIGNHVFVLVRGPKIEHADTISDMRKLDMSDRIVRAGVSNANK